MGKVITEIRYNWRQVIDNGRDAGEDFDYYEVGKIGVISITEHLPKGEGDKWCYVVDFENGERRTIFNPNVVIEKEVS